MPDFTQGKWEVDCIYGDHWVVNSDERVIIDCFKSEANARLIAAAPEIYELLKVWTQIGAQPTLMKQSRKHENS